MEKDLKKTQFKVSQTDIRSMMQLSPGYRNRKTKSVVFKFPS